MSDEPKDHHLKAETGRFKTMFSNARLIVHNPLPDEHSFFGQVGRIVAGMAQFEHTLDLIIWELSGLEPAEGSCITAQLMGFRPRFEAIEALWLLRNRDSKILKAIRDLRTKAEGPNAERNRYVHDAWFVEAGSGQVAQFKSYIRGEKTYGIADVDEAKLTALVKA